MADYEFDDSGIYSSRRPLEERWPPLGAAMDSSVHENSDENKKSDHIKLQELEEEHEELNTSLISLTNHFAQVQFRLKQVVAAPQEEKEKLLLALEDFAFQGCPDVRGGSKTVSQCSSPPSLDDTSKAVGLQKQKQDRLISQLKQQLEEMEKCVAEDASNSLGDDMDPEKLIEKQRIVLEQLKARTGLKLDGFDKMSDDDVRRNVDSALGQVMNPKTKEQLVKQLTSQIIDLEKFVKFLQDEVNTNPPKTETTHLQYPVSSYPIHVTENERITSKDRSKPYNNSAAPTFKQSTSSLTERPKDLGYDFECSLNLSPEDNDNGCCLHVPLTPEQARSKRIRDASLAIIRRALSILQIFAISQFGCTGKQIQDQIMRKTASVAVPGYFELLSKLQASVENVAQIKYALDQDSDWSEPSSPRSPDSAKSISRQNSRRSRASSVSSVDTAVLEERFNYARDAELVNTVRKDLAMALKEVMQHGLVRTVDSRLISSKSLVACIVPTTRTSLPQRMHVWELFNSYYSLKRGREYNSTPASRLSEAFGIPLDGSGATTSKQTLLRTLHRIKTTHEPCRRSMDAMFKSLVCAGLNQKTLVQWCRIVTRTTTIVEDHYQPWAYVVKSGMSEALTYLERLQPFDFHLPEDLAIRHLTKINDAFGEP